MQYVKIKFILLYTGREENINFAGDINIQKNPEP